MAGTFNDVVWAFVVSYTAPYIMQSIGGHIGYIFGVCSVISFFFAVFFLPELAGRSLEEVDELFEVSRTLTHLVRHSPAETAIPMGVAIQERQDVGHWCGDRCARGWTSGGSEQDDRRRRCGDEPSSHRNEGELLWGRVIR